MLLTIDSKKIFGIKQKQNKANILSKADLGGCGILKPGKYMISIAPIWSDTVRIHPDFKTILLDIYCPELLTLN